MATTDNYGYSLPDSGSAGYDAAVNGNFIDIDKQLKEASDLLIWDDNTAGRIDGSEVLTYNGNVLGWA